MAVSHDIVPKNNVVHLYNLDECEVCLPVVVMQSIKYREMVAIETAPPRQPTFHRDQRDGGVKAAVPTISRYLIA